ncbi:MAG: Zn-dependent hydrolase [Bacteroidota bacterium]|nr:Zn-dependent hydrolase [Bacteroidota bacterium]
MKRIMYLVVAGALTISIIACNNAETQKEESAAEKTEMEMLVDNYAEVELKTDLSYLSDNQKEMLGILIDVADIMEEIFWMEAIGEKDAFLADIDDEATRKYACINYGPWDRLNGDKSFMEGFGEKPKGAKYYPVDITKAEFDAWENENKNSWYTLVKRDENGDFYNVWYHEAFADEINKAADLLEKAADLAEDEGFENFLRLRAEAFRTDDYLASDLAWMEMQENMIDFVVGPIESYEDQFMGNRSAHSGQLLIKDIEWSEKLAYFGQFLPELQASLPVPEEYKQEEAHANADMNVYDVVYYGGDCNAGGKNIAINLPNDPRVHAQKGSRKLQLKNSMQAKFDKILVPISEVLVVEEQRENISFDAFFENVMFHEVAHGLGVKQTINSDETVRDALADYYSGIEEAKADITGLFLVTQLHKMEVITDKDLKDNYVTFLAGIFRSVRFGASSAHGKANMIEFYYLMENGAIERNDESQYKVNFERMKEVIAELSGLIIQTQGDGNYDFTKKWLDEKGVVGETLQADLDRVNDAGIPKDIVFKQGKDVLGI